MNKKNLFFLFLFLLVLPISYAKEYTTSSIKEDFNTVNLEYDKEDLLYLNYSTVFSDTTYCYNSNSDFIDEVCFLKTDNDKKADDLGTAYNFSIFGTGILENTDIKSGGGKHLIIRIKFNETLRFTNASQIKIRANNTQSQPNTYWWTFFDFIEENQPNCTLVIGDESALVDNTLGAYTMSDKVCGITQHSAVFSDYILDTHAFRWNESFSTTIIYSPTTFDNASKFDYLFMDFYWGGGSLDDTMHLDWIELTDINYGENELPTGSISMSIDSNFCWNDSTEYVDIPVSTNYVTDIEGDTIYFATSKYKDLGITRFMSFDKESMFNINIYIEYMRCLLFASDTYTCQFGMSQPLNFWTRYINVSTTCTIRDSMLFDYTGSFPYWDYNNITNWRFAYDINNCNQSILFADDFFSNYKDYALSFDIEMTTDSAITYKGSNFPDSYNFFRRYNITRNSTTTLIYENDVLIVNTTYKRLIFRLSRVGYDYNYDLNIKGVKYNGKNVELFSGLRNSIGVLTSKMNFQIQEGKVYLDDLTFFEGFIYDEWTTSLSDYQRFYRSGTHLPFVVYITDDKHINASEYRIDYNYITIPDCSDMLYNIPSSFNLSSIILPLDNLLGNPSRTLIDELELDLVINGMLWFMYVGMLFFFIISGYVLRRRLDIIFPILASSFLTGFVTLLLNKWYHFTVALIGLAFGLAIIIVKSQVGTK